MERACATPHPMSAWLDLSRSAVDVALGLANLTTTVMAASTRGLQAAEPAAMARPPRGSASWYKAPYRSPFDPLFWLAPGHPLDHAAELSRLAFGSALAVSTSPALWLWSRQSTAWPSLPWSGFAPTRGVDLDYRSGAGAASNVVDFKEAYAAYRTATGHAVAQIAPPEANRRPIGQTEPMAQQFAMMWSTPFAVLAVLYGRPAD